MNTLDAAVQAVEKLVAAGDTDSVAAVLAAAAAQPLAIRHRGTQLQLAVVLRADQDIRLAVATALAGRHRDLLAQGADVRLEERRVVLLLAGIVGSGLDLPAAESPESAAEREAWLRELGAAHSFWYADRLDALARSALDSGSPLAPPVVATFRRTAVGTYHGPEIVALAKRLTDPVLNVGELWADTALTDAAELGGAWPDLLAHAVTATFAKPTAGWDKQARALLDRLTATAATAGAAAPGSVTAGAAAPGPAPAPARTAAPVPAGSAPDTSGTATVGADADADTPDPATAQADAGADAGATVRDRLTSWLALVGRPRTLRLAPGPNDGDVNELYDPYNANALRGLAWTLSLLPPHPDSARALGRLTETSLRKVAGTGPRNPKVAGAAVVALSRTEGEAALAELARLATRVTFKGTLKQIDAALQARAQALGLTREEIEELAVPGYGLTEVGRRSHEHGELAVAGSRAVLRWRSPAGKEVKSPPAAVKRERPELLAELKAAAKDIDKMLSAQSERLDRQFLARRTWPFGAWRTAYRDHPLVGTLARRLLWTVGGTPCGYADGALRTLAGDRLPDPAADAAVELWHPVGRESAEVMAWRDWLERYGITQPFKQAHREVYLLTDAERATGTYSNRFAGHILRQHQFHALAAVRGWRNNLRLMVDDVYPPAVRELPRWGLRAEFWVQGEGGDYGVDTTESGSYLRVATDQIRFYALDAPQNLAHASGGGYGQGRGVAPPATALPVAEIPPLVLSEVLRDADLFVGVASVGNDPTWEDGGPDGRFRDYWHSYGFGELVESARGRRDLLARIVPRLAIADRATVEERFLVVRGDLHTYRIHLGSGNILMSPGDRYLCIVPKSTAQAGGEVGYLPFEGDRTLSVILSKALLLARDTAITDPSILSQL